MNNTKNLICKHSKYQKIKPRWSFWNEQFWTIWRICCGNFFLSRFKLLDPCDERCEEVQQGARPCSFKGEYMWSWSLVQNWCSPLHQSPHDVFLCTHHCPFALCTEPVGSQRELYWKLLICTKSLGIIILSISLMCPIDVYHTVLKIRAHACA